MKNLNILLTSALFAAVMLTGNAQAEPRSDRSLYDIIHPESADLFYSDDALKSSKHTGITNLNDANSSGDIVWSYEYEEYVSTSDFAVDDSPFSALEINRYMSSHPTAAGKTGEDVFKWDATYDGYMLQ